VPPTDEWGSTRWGGWLNELRRPGNAHAAPWHGSYQCVATRVIQIQGSGQQLHGVRIGTVALAALERPDGMGRQAGPLGKILLRQSGCLAELP